MDCVVSHLISLRFLRFRLGHFQRGRELNREIFVPLLISPRLVLIQFRDCIGSDLGIARQIMRGENCTHITRLWPVIE